MTKNRFKIGQLVLPRGHTIEARILDIEPYNRSFKRNWPNGDGFRYILSGSDCGWSSDYLKLMNASIIKERLGVK